MALYDPLKVENNEVVGDFYNNHNSLVDAAIVSGSMVTNGLLRLVRNGGSPLDIAVPKTPNSVLSGAQASLVGNTITITAGSWTIDGVEYNRPTPTSFNIDPLADTTKKRIDIVAATNTGTFVVIKGTEEVIPLEPTLPANRLRITTILLDADGSTQASAILPVSTLVSLLFETGKITALPAITTTGQTAAIDLANTTTRNARITANSTFSLTLANATLAVAEGKQLLLSVRFTAAGTFDINLPAGSLVDSQAGASKLTFTPTVAGTTYLIGMYVGTLDGASARYFWKTSGGFV